VKHTTHKALAPTTVKVRSHRICQFPLRRHRTNQTHWISWECSHCLAVRWGAALTARARHNATHPV